MAYNGTVFLPDGIRQMNGQNYPLVDAPAVRVTDTKRLDAKLAELDASITELDASIEDQETAQAALAGDIAEAFSENKPYSVGEYVMKDGVLYRFTENHAAGAWTGSDVTTEKIAPVVGELNAQLYEVEKTEIYPVVNLHYYPTDEKDKTLVPATGETAYNAGTYVSDFILVKDYDTLYFYNVAYVYQYGKNKNYLNIYSAPENFVKNTECAYIRISMVNTNYDRKIVSVTTTDVNAPYISPYDKAANRSNVRAKYADIYEGSFDVKISGKQLLDKNIIYQNFTINAYGEASSASNYNLSEYIPVDNAETKITISKGSKVAQYNENKDFVPGTQENLSPNGNNTITLTPYTKYIRVVYYYTQNCMVEYGETPSAYEEAKYGVFNTKKAIDIATPGDVSTAKAEALAASETYTNTAKASGISTANGYTDEQIKAKRRFINYCTKSGVVIDKLNSSSNFTTTKYPNTADVSFGTTERESLIDSGLLFTIMRDTTSDCALEAIKHIDSIDLSNKEHITFWVYLERLSDNDEIAIRFYSGSTDANYRALAADYTNKMYYGWQMVSLYKADFTTGSSFNWNNITDISFRIVAKKKGPANNNSDYLKLVFNDLRVGMEFQPKIIFRFDDALKGVYNCAYPLLKQRGFGAITYSNALFTQRADNPTEVDPTASALAGTTVYYKDVYCTTQELTEMYSNRIDVGNHSRSHLVFTDSNAHYDYMDTDDAETRRTSVLYQILKGQRALIEMGFARSARHFAVPGGHDTDFCQQALIESGTLTSTNSQHSDNSPNVNPHKIHAWGIGKDTTVNAIEGYISDAVAKGRTVVLMFHDIVDEYNNYTEQEYQYLTTNFETILDYIVNQGWSDYVVNMSEWYDGLNRDSNEAKWNYQK